ncbi:tail tape measure protein [Ochrobactrum sp. SFR4]|uniref:tail tape measure protein n=1 Tax=Ochrobactrum sp. SFR4 TaxID=2717368 RepID=UPI001C8B65EB|nr:tail tape measure protein [Ochrobactrum sp. SFR4]MBX8827269.1 tail tape measure protein [Ochrobactrum sp. SFR4]
MSRNDIMAFIGANARGFHDAMTRVRGDTKATAKNAQREFSDLSAGLNRSMALVKGALAGVGVGLSIQGVKQVISDIGNIETAAKRAGMTIKSFQQMKYVAETNRIEVDAMADAFRELNLRANEYAQTGKGSGAEAFAQLGMSPEEVKKRLKDPADFMLEIIDRTRRLKDTAAGIRIFDEIMGGQGGEQFVSLIEQGRDKLTETIKEGEELGRVLSDDVVQAAADVDRKFQEISNTVSGSLKGAIVDAYQALQVFVASFSAMEERSSEALRANQQQLQTRRKQLEEQKGTKQDSALWLIGKDAATEMVEVDKQLKTINDELERRNKLTAITDTTIPPPVTPYILPAETKTKGGGSRSAKISDAEREKKAIDDLIASLEEELALVGLTDEARDKEVALRKVGASATDAQRNQITALIEARYQEQKAVEAVEEQLRRNADAALDLADISMNMIDTIIDGSFSAKEALAGLLRQMSQAMLMGQGPLANLFGISPQSSGLGGLFGMMFGGARAAGGSVTPGNLYRVNEKGEEFFSPGTHGRIIPHGSAGGAGNSISLAPVYQIDAKGSNMTPEQFKSVIEEVNKRSLPQLAAQIQQLNMRGMLS